MCHGNYLANITHCDTNYQREKRERKRERERERNRERKRKGYRER